MKAKENDCFSWHETEGLWGHGECFALDKIQPGCGTVECPFYKPDKKYIRTEKDGEVYFKYKGKIIEVPADE